jgi:hypothetical protein
VPNEGEKIPYAIKKDPLKTYKNDINIPSSKPKMLATRFSPFNFFIHAMWDPNGWNF